MKKSQFNLVYPSYPIDGYVLMFNTLSKSVSVLETQYYDDIQSDDYKLIPDNILDMLYKQGFILKNTENEIAKLNMFYAKAKTNFSVYATMILTTYDCNMKCSYCFENSIKDQTTVMSQKTASDVCNWLKNEYLTCNSEYLSVVFSGGEPLLNKPTIEIIIAELNQFASEHNKTFKFGFLTNGTISISSDEATRWKKQGLDFIQYTIDGNRDVHNQRRVYRDGSYDIILDNIRKNYQNTNCDIIVRVNLDMENADQLSGLLDDLKKLNNPKMLIDYAPRLKTSCDNCNINHFILSDEKIGEKIITFLQQVNEKGLVHSRRFTDAAPCLATTLRQFVIDPSGDLYKCAGFAGIKEFCVGSIYDKNLNDVYTQIVGLEEWQNCKMCKFVPLCAGGCLLLNYLESNDYRKKNCQYKVMDSTVMQTLIQSLDREYVLQAVMQEKKKQKEMCK